METFAERLDVASGTRSKFEPERILLQDRGDWFGTRLEIWESSGASELPETVLFQHGLCINEHIAPSEVRFAGGRPLSGRSCTGSVVILPAGLPYRAVGWGATRNIVLGVRPEVIMSAIRTRGARSVELTPSYGIADNFLEHSMRALAADVREGSPVGSLYGDTILAALAAHLVRNYSADPRLEEVDLGERCVQREMVRQLILDRLGEALTLRDMSGSLGLDVYTFGRWFKKAFGIPPHRYVLEARIDRAKQLLQRSSMTLVEVAAECGFSSQSHFTSVFRNRLGVTPAAFRAAFRGRRK